MIPWPSLRPVRSHPLPALTLVLALLLPGLAGAAEELVLGMFAYRPKAVLAAQWRPLGDYLSQALPGHRVRVEILTQEEIAPALARGELDFLFTNPNHFVALRQSHALSGALATLVSLEGGRPSASLGGVVIRRPERTDLQTLGDLVGQRVAAAGINYMGGYLAQAAELVAAGVDLQRLRLRFTGQPHDKVIQAVLDGQADAGFVRTGVIEQMVREGRLRPDQLAVVQPRPVPGFPYRVSTRLYPEWPMVALPWVDPQLARRLAAALLALEPEHPVSRAAGIHGFTVPADYSVVEQTLRDLRLPPFERAPRFDWHDVWERYWPILALSMLAGAALLVLNLRLADARREALNLAGRLERERLHLQTLVRTLPDLVWLKDAQGVYQRCNPRFEALFGRPEAEIAGRGDTDLFDPATAEAFRVADAQAREQRGARVDETWLDFRDGHRELVEITRTPMYDPQGRLLGVLGIGHDVTERAETEQLLEIQHRFARFLVGDPDRDALLDALLEVPLSLPGVDGGGLYWRHPDDSFRLVRHRGLSEAFLAQVDTLAPGSPHHDLIRAGRIQCSCAQPGSHCTSPDLVQSPGLPDEGIRVLVVLPILVNGEAEACLNLASKSQDQISARTLAALETLTRQFTRAVERLTAREQAEAGRQRLETLYHALRDSEEALRRAQAMSNTGSWTLDIAADRLAWSDQTYRIFGLPPGQPMTLGEFLARVHPDDQALVENAWRAALAGAPYDLEHRVLADGAVKWVRERAEISLGEDGAPRYGLGTVQDISERKRLEEIQRFGAFQAGVAEMGVSVLHNIGNAITSVVADTNAVSRASEELGRVAALLEKHCDEFGAELDRQGGGLDARQAQYLLTVQRQAAGAIARLYQQGLAMRSRRINASVQHIADIVRIQQNAALPSARNAPFDLGKALEDALAMQGDTLAQHGIQVELEVDPALGQVNLSRNRLLQALINVFKNAYEAIRERQAQETDPDWRGVIRVRAAPLADGRFRIRVSDNGVGLARAQLPELFRFGYSTKDRGSGFGLHATALFVQELEGDIDLESDGPNRGASLVMTLPRGLPVRAEERDARSEREIGSPA